MKFCQGGETAGISNVSSLLVRETERVTKSSYPLVIASPGDGVTLSSVTIISERKIHNAKLNRNYHPIISMTHRYY